MDEDVTRRRLLASGAAAVGTALAGCSLDSPGDDPDDGPRVALDPVAEGLVAPVGLEAPPGTERLYVVDQPGRVHVVGRDGRSTFLDLTDRVVPMGGGYTERGLLGLAFHPAFPADPRVFVRYSAPPRPGTPDEFAHTFVLASIEATPERADPSTERSILEIPQPQANHNAGSIVFGPDGLLYVGVGDGGGAGDRGRGHVDDWYDAVPGGNGQDVTGNLLGSILRLDVDGGDPYAIPSDNPLVGRGGRDEHYAWGFRNPWRMSFDRERLIVADVGQNVWEEVNVVEAGGNYGWNVREGPACFSASDCPTVTPDGNTLRDPVLAYPHTRDGELLGIAVVGGYVARGDALPSFEGRYVFGDWSRSFRAPSGTLFVATPTDAYQWPMERVTVAGTDTGELGRYVLGFGRDPAGDVYVCTNRAGGPAGDTGAIHRLVAP